MTDETPWTNRPVGVVVRVLFGLVGLLLGLASMAVAFFGASYKNTQPEWDGESLVFLVLGLLAAASALAAAARPSRGRWAVALAAIVAVPVAGALL